MATEKICRECQRDNSNMSRFSLRDYDVTPPRLKRRHNCEFVDKKEHRSDREVLLEVLSRSCRATTMLPLLD